MSGNGGFFSRLGYKLKMGLTRFMQGRYGTDKLNSVILWTGLVVCIVSMFVPMGWPAGYAVLCVFGHRHVPLFFPQYLQAVSGKPPVHVFSGAHQRPGAPVLHLPQVPPERPGSPGKGKNFHHLPQMPGKIRQKNLIINSGKAQSFPAFSMPFGGS